MIGLTKLTRLSMFSAVFVFWVAAVNAAVPVEPKAIDFAYSSQLSPKQTGSPSEGKLIRVEIPHHVYEGVLRNDLGDIRVFNAAGDAVPFDIVTHQELTLQKQRETQFQILPFVQTKVENDKDDIQVVELSRDESGTIRGIHVDESKTEKSTEPHRSVYLLDLRDSKVALESMKFDWVGPHDGRFIPVKVEESEDLQAWSEVGSGVLVDAQNGGHAMIQKMVRVGVRPHMYLRVTLQAPESVAKLTKIEGGSIDSDGASESLDGLASKGIEGRIEGDGIVYDTGGVFPISKFALRLSPGTAAHVKIESSSQAAGPWTPRADATIFNVNLQGGSSESEPFAMASVTDRFWRVTPEGTNQELKNHPPKMVFQWQAKNIVILPNGAGPFRLAYGSYLVSGNAPQLQKQIADQLKSGKAFDSFEAGPRELSGGTEKLIAAPVHSSQTYILPGVLVLAVLLIAHQAWRLIQDMKNKPNSGV